MKFSPSIWRYVVNIKLAVKISSILMAFLKDINFTVTFHKILEWCYFRTFFTHCVKLLIFRIWPQVEKKVPQD